MKSTRLLPRNRLAQLGIALPLALALAACGGEAGDVGGPSGEPIAAIEAPEGTAWVDTVTISEDGGYIVGNPEAPIKLTEFASHTCGACAYFAQSAKSDLKDKYIASGVVSFEQREVFLNTLDLVIATVVQCGPKEMMQPLSDEFWQNHTDIMQTISANQQAVAAADSLSMDQRFVAIGEGTGIVDFFAARGLSADQARSCLADGAKIEALAESVAADAQANSIAGTPTFQLNGQTLDMNQWSDIEPALQRAGAR